VAPDSLAASQDARGAQAAWIFIPVSTVVKSLIASSCINNEGAANHTDMRQTVFVRDKDILATAALRKEIEPLVA
jgi:hypothetical protein